MVKRKSQELDLPAFLFTSANKWEKWLAENHNTSKGLWLKISKKDSGVDTVNYNDALEIAICYGWIDGQKKSFDGKYFLQKFTPRRAKSIWSKRNCGIAIKLINSKKMQPPGQAVIDAAKKDGRWDAAYDSPKNMKVPEDFLTALKKNKKAGKFFNTLNRANLFAIAFRLHTAKKNETRAGRINTIIKMLERNEKFH